MEHLVLTIFEPSKERRVKQTSIGYYWTNNQNTHPFCHGAMKTASTTCGLFHGLHYGNIGRCTFRSLSLKNMTADYTFADIGIMQAMEQPNSSVFIAPWQNCLNSILEPKQQRFHDTTVTAFLWSNLQSYTDALYSSF
jgi:hypothetical protein